MLQEIKRDFRNWTVIFDLPPILSSDDVISILPRLDCVAFVVGAGTTTAEEIKECNKHLESAEIVRVILNKSEDTTAAYYYSYSAPHYRPSARIKTSQRIRTNRLPLSACRDFLPAPAKINPLPSRSFYEIKFVAALNREERASALNVAVAARAPRETSPAAISSRRALPEFGQRKE